MQLRKAQPLDLEAIMPIINYAIESRKKDGSHQWQDGYPNQDSISDDIQHGYGYVIEDNLGLLAYGAVIFDKEPAYDTIDGNWLSQQDYVVIHRLAVATRAKGKSLGSFFLQEVEALAVSKNRHSIKIDTNYDNIAMLRILATLGYQYCGEVHYKENVRKAFEKLI